MIWWPATRHCEKVNSQLVEQCRVSSPENEMGGAWKVGGSSSEWEEEPVWWEKMGGGCTLPENRYTLSVLYTVCLTRIERCFLLVAEVGVSLYIRWVDRGMRLINEINGIRAVHGMWTQFSRTTCIAQRGSHRGGLRGFGWEGKRSLAPPQPQFCHRFNRYYSLCVCKSGS